MQLTFPKNFERKTNLAVAGSDCVIKKSARTLSVTWLLHPIPITLRALTSHEKSLFTAQTFIRIRLLHSGESRNNPFTLLSQDEPQFVTLGLLSPP